MRHVLVVGSSAHSYNGSNINDYSGAIKIFDLTNFNGGNSTIEQIAHIDGNISHFNAWST